MLPTRPRANYDAENEEEEVLLPSMDSWALTPDCKHLAFVWRDKIYVWDTATGKRRELPVTTGEILLHRRSDGGCGGMVDIRKRV